MPFFRRIHIAEFDKKRKFHLCGCANTLNIRLVWRLSEFALFCALTSVGAFFVFTGQKTKERRIRYNTAKGFVLQPRTVLYYLLEVSNEKTIFTR